MRPIQRTSGRVSEGEQGPCRSRWRSEECADHWFGALVRAPRGESAAIPLEDTARFPMEWAVWERLSETLQAGLEGWRGVEVTLATAVGAADTLERWALDNEEVEDDERYLALAHELQEACFPRTPLPLPSPVSRVDAVWIGAMVALGGILAGMVLLP